MSNEAQTPSETREVAQDPETAASRVEAMVRKYVRGHHPHLHVVREICFGSNSYFGHTILVRDGLVMVCCFDPTEFSDLQEDDSVRLIANRITENLCP